MTSFIHLGHRINSDLCDKDDIWHRRRVFIGQVYNVMCYFPRLATDARYKLFRSYCNSIFGCELWHLIGSNVDTFCTAWRSGLRRACNLPNKGKSKGKRGFV